MKLLRTCAVIMPLWLLAACQTPPPPPLLTVFTQEGPEADGSAAHRPGDATSISTERMSEITRVLASNEFQGRSMGTAGEKMTIAYLIEQFRSAGLEPGGENGGWTQKVPLIHTKLQSPQVSVRHGSNATQLDFPNDIYLSTVRDTQQARITNAPIVFVGFGVHAPERGWDDFKGVDLKGKVALFLVNDPDFEASPEEPVAGKFGDKTMTYYGRWTYKFEEAARRGAIGAIIIHETEGAGYGWNVVESAAGENFNIVLPPGAQQPVLLQGWIQQAAGEAMLKRSGHDYAALKRQARMAAFRPIELEASLSASAGVDLARVTSQNVIGKLTGARYPDETVSYSGHWDAYGVGTPDTQGRTVRPGAADDALGIAAMIEIARLFAAGPLPERTLVFAAWTAEERGLLGSEYYAQHPLYPHETMVANLTLDTLQWAGPTRDTLLIGRGQSELERYLEEGARAQGRYVTPEGRPERGLFYRADHFSFAKRGVPVLLSMALAGAYDLQDGGRAAGERWLDAFTTSCYHQTCDAWSPNWDLRGAAQEAELYYGIGARLASSRDWPEWNPGSEFKELRDKSTNDRRPGAQMPPTSQERR
jgi:Zn-dependent M28 family amino/carboxypeptidase